MECKKTALIKIKWLFLNLKETLVRNQLSNVDLQFYYFTKSGVFECSLHGFVHIEAKHDPKKLAFISWSLH